MKVVNLLRTKFTDHGTFGLVSFDGLRMKSLELPWRNNMRKLSCIPTGDYKCQIVNSPRFGRVYGVLAVSGRSSILIHSANLAGDRIKGFDTQLEGCIAMYERDGFLTNSKGRMQKAGLVSRPAVTRLMQWANSEPFTLKIDSFES